MVWTPKTVYHTFLMRNQLERLRDEMEVEYDSKPLKVNIILRFFKQQKPGIIGCEFF